MSLLIVMIIVVPGYFIINRLATKLFYGDESLADQTEKSYGFKKLEDEFQDDTSKKD